MKSLTALSNPYRYVEGLETLARDRIRLPEARRGGGGRKRKSGPVSKTETVVTIKELHAFVKAIGELKAKNREDVILFRGQKDSIHPLLPKIGRPGAVKGQNQSDLAEREKLMFESFKRFSLPYLKANPQ